MPDGASLHPGPGAPRAGGAPALERTAAWAAASPVTLAIGALNLAGLLATMALGSATDGDVLVRAGALERGAVWSGEPWRLLTAAFLHFGWIHWAWNTLLGVAACRPVERALGSGRFAVVYVASALGSSAVSLLGQDAVAAGASGALSGVLGAALVLHGQALGSARAFLASRATHLTAAVAILFSVVASRFASVDHLGHAGGLAAGAALTAALVIPPRPRVALAVAACTAVLAALALAAAWPRERLTAYTAFRLDVDLVEALRRDDLAAASAVVARADRLGHRSNDLDYNRALLRTKLGDLDGALELLRPLLARAREEHVERYRKAVAYAAAHLAYRHATGLGAREDPAAAHRLWLEACAAGDPQSCAAAGGAVPAAP